MLETIIRLPPCARQSLVRRHIKNERKVTLPGLAPAACAMSRTDTALKPLTENSSSAAARIASRMLGLRIFSLSGLFIAFVHMYK